MKNSKKFLSLLLVAVLLIGSLVVSSVSVSGDDATPAFLFMDSDYASDVFKLTSPDFLECDTDEKTYGSFRIQNETSKEQYQMAFKLTGENKERLKDAIKSANKFYTGRLYTNITVNNCVDKDGKKTANDVCITIGFASKGKYGPDIFESDRKAIGTGKTTKFTFSVEQDKNGDNLEERLDEIDYLYICVDFYTAGRPCMPDMKFNEIVVEDGVTRETEPPSTEPYDTTQLTLNRFGNGTNYQAQTYAPTKLEYSSNGINFRSERLTETADFGYMRLTQDDECTQIQTRHFLSDQEATRSAIANANNGGTGYAYIDVALEKCIDRFGKDVIAEVAINILTQKGIYEEKPDNISVKAWQYPGTTRRYYLDISNLSDDTQISSIDIFVQNYWYYDTAHKIFDYDTQEREAGRVPDEEAAFSLGYKKCYIQEASVVISPIKIEETVKNPRNSDYSLALNGYNKEGKMPSDADKVNGDINAYIGGVTEKPTGTTAGGASGAITGANTLLRAPIMNNVVLTGKTSAKVSWKAAAGATSYNIYRSNYPSSGYKAIKTGVKSLYFVDNTLAGGKTYYYKVEAVKDNLKKISAAKYVKVLKYSAKPVIKLNSAKKALKLKFKTKVANATTYQVYYSTSKKFKGKKVITVTGNKKIKLKAKTKYYVKARAITVIGGRKYYSKWSKVVNKKTK